MRARALGCVGRLAPPHTPEEGKPARLQKSLFTPPSRDDAHPRTGMLLNRCGPALGSLIDGPAADPGEGVLAQSWTSPLARSNDCRRAQRRERPPHLCPTHEHIEVASPRVSCLSKLGLNHGRPAGWRDPILVTAMEMRLVSWSCRALFLLHGDDPSPRPDGGLWKLARGWSHKLDTLVRRGTARPPEPVSHQPLGTCGVGKHLVVRDGLDTKAPLDLTHARLPEDVPAVDWGDGLGQALVAHVIYVHTHGKRALLRGAPEWLITLRRPQGPRTAVSKLRTAERVQPGHTTSEAHAATTPQRTARRGEGLVHPQLEVGFEEPRSVDVQTKHRASKLARARTKIRLGAHHVLDRVETTRLPQHVAGLRDHWLLLRGPAHPSPTVGLAWGGSHRDERPRALPQIGHSCHARRIALREGGTPKASDVSGLQMQVLPVGGAPPLTDALRHTPLAAEGDQRGRCRSRRELLQ